MLIGEWIFDCDARELIRDGRKAKLEPQSALVLQHLCDRAGEVVSHDELLDVVWGREAVSVQSVPVVISKLRSQLGDNKANPTYIETIHKAGYRLIANVTETNKTRTVDGFRPRPQIVVNRLARSAFAAAILFGLLWWALAPTPAKISSQHLYVTDVANLTKDPDLDATAAGAIDVLMAEIVGVQGLTVTRLKNLGVHKETDSDGKEGAGTQEGWLLTASIIPSDGNAEVLMQLEDRAQKTVTWSYRYILDRDGYSDNQRRAAQGLLRQLNLQNSPTASSYGSKIATVEELYRRANFLWGLRGQENNMLAAILARKAVSLDPSYVPAHALLAEIFAKYSSQYLGIEEVDTVQLAKEHLHKAMSLAPDHATVLASRTRMLMLLDRRPDLALKVAEQNIAAEPENSMAYQQKAAALYILGQPDESVRALRGAVEKDSESPYIKAQFIPPNYLNAKYQAVVSLAESLPSEYLRAFRVMVASSYHELGRYEEAIITWFACLDDLKIPSNERQAVLQLVKDGSVILAYERLLAIIDQHPQSSGEPFYPLQLTWRIYAGQYDDALKLLNSVPINRSNRFLLWLHRWPIFDHFQGNEEFQHLLDEIGVARYAVCDHPACLSQR